MIKRYIAALVVVPAALLLGSTASAQLKFINKIKELAETAENVDAAVTGAEPATPQPATPEAATLVPVASPTATLAATGEADLAFNVELGEPPIAVARDTTCENVAATNPADLVGNVLSSHKDEIVDVLKARYNDQPPTVDQSALMDSARLEMKRQVWLPLAIEETVGQRILAERQTAIIPRDDPAAAEAYANVQPVFDKLKASTEGLQPYSLNVMVISDGSTQPNAETLPGGIILVNEALAQADSERIFAYLSHELGHVTKRHQTMALQAKLIDGAQGVDALSELTNLSGEALLDKVLGVVDLTAALFTQYYTAQELEADACGGKYLAGAPENDGAKSIEIFLADVGQNEKVSDVPAAESDALVKEEHPSYGERRQVLVDSYRFWSTPQ